MQSDISRDSLLRGGCATGILRQGEREGVPDDVRR